MSEDRKLNEKRAKKEDNPVKRKGRKILKATGYYYQVFFKYIIY